MATITTDEQFIIACSWLVDNNQLPVQGERFIDRVTRQVFDERPNPDPPPEYPNQVLLVDITPDTVTLEAALDSANAQLTIEATIADAKSGLKDKISLAQTHADAIRRIFNTVLDQTINQTAQPTRWNNIKAEIDHVNTANAFKVRFAKDVLEELGFDANGVLSAAQIRQATLYTRMWITGLALLLSEA